jgi:hypothetical protein
MMIAGKKGPDGVREPDRTEGLSLEIVAHLPRSPGSKKILDLVMRCLTHLLALLENMRCSRVRVGIARTLSKREIEERLDEMLRHGGELPIQRLRDEAREIARVLKLPDEFQRLDGRIGTMLGTRDVPLVSPVGAARAAGLPYGSSRKCAVCHKPQSMKLPIWNREGSI